jgi:hypothetical protein
MAYIVNKTDGTAVTTITDGTIDNTTSLTLFGKSYSGFGELLNEDLVKLLENSASTSAPTSPLKGEVWFDTTVNQLKVYDGTSFKPTGGAKSSAGTAPTSPSVGDLWLNTTTGQLFVYTGQTYSAWQAFSGWELAGPEFTSGQTLSGFKIETVRATSSVDYVVAFMYSGNIRVACVSQNAEFTPQSTITGFAKIYPGITLNSTLAAVFAGTTTSTTHVNVDESTNNTSGSIIAGKNFLRSDVADNTIGRITVLTDTGVVIGAGSDLQLTVSDINATIANVSEDGDLSIKINSTGNVIKTPIAITGSTGNIALTGDVTITGNLSVSGEYANTTSNINIIDDAFVKLNTGNSEVDAGIIVETTDTDDARLFYQVSTNTWVAGENASYSQIIRLTDAVTDGDANKGKVLKTTGAGNVKVTSLTLGAVGSNIATSDTSNLNVPTTGQVAESIKRWGGDAITADAGSTGNTVAGARYVETVAPNDGQGSNGDLWFVREA